MLIAVLLFNTLQAQIKPISDEDAKLYYQKAEDAYNATDYYRAAIIAINVLQIRMDKWTPKTLSLFLKSVYKNFTETNQISQQNFKKNDYLQYSSYYNDCNQFFKMVDQATYPADKYKEIQDIQAYFKQKMEQFAYQKDRTPDKAIAFLNECAAKFPNPEIGGYDLRGIQKELKFTHIVYGNKTVGNYINFKIDSGYLHIRALTKDQSQHGKNLNEVYSMYDIIDLQHSPSLDKDTVNTGEVYFYPRHETHYTKDFTVPEQDTLLLQKQRKDDADYFTGYTYHLGILNTRNKNTFSFKENELVIQYPILDFFDNKNKEFIDGGYAGRIEEAFKYLTDYYPKQKQQQKSAQRDKGF